MGSFQNRLNKENTVFHDEITALQFRVFSSAEILDLSVCHVTSPRSFDSLQHPMTAGLYDLRMGPHSNRSWNVCQTCHLQGDHCPGHLGHIELPLPVYHPLFYKNLHVLLKMSCLHCHRLKCAYHMKTLFIVQQKLLDRGLIIAAQEAAEFVARGSSDEEETRRSRIADENHIVSRLKDFLNDVIESDGGKVVDSESLLASTQCIESLRKSYMKNFRDECFSYTCNHCGAQYVSLITSNSRFLYDGEKFGEEDGLESSAVKKEKKSMHTREKTELNPKEIKEHLRNLWALDHEALLYLFPLLKYTTDGHPTDLFFIDNLAVPPPKTRPSQETGNMIIVHPLSATLELVIEHVSVLKQALQVVNGVDLEELSEEARDLINSLKGETPLIKVDEVWRELQWSVNAVLDKEMSKSSRESTSRGLKQLIERKEGLFRMHMMGKRVNFAARTVITPDPNIDIDEIGIPDVFAKKLSYRVAVTPWNVEDLREMVRNGPDVYPGAIFVEEEGGKKVVIPPNDSTKREAIAKTLLLGSNDSKSTEVKVKFVHRHLKNGDAMLLNRQPTLHKPSIMSHRARVLKGERVMRLHYSVCKSYNADFDGDEMNAHFPQNEVARSEAYNIVNVCRQYLGPKDGAPLQGLIQDHIIAGVKMTVRGRFFTRAEYQQHVFQALVNLPGEIKTLPPAILKPVHLWSGKQIISTIVLNLVPKGKPGPTLDSDAKIKNDLWQEGSSRAWKAGGTSLAMKPSHGPTMSEAEVIFRKGEFISGILDKNQYGATRFSLVHAFFELYGGIYSGKLQSAFSKLFTNFLHTEGFTLGVRDILVTDEANLERKKIMRETKKIGDDCAAKGVGFDGIDETDHDMLNEMLEQFHRESRTIPKRKTDVDRAYKEKLGPANNAINKACLPGGLIEKFPLNNLQLMVLSGAKGSTVNTMQISCLLGQIELEGKRPPLMISGRSLPSFRPYDTQPRAGGFIDGRFMTGIRPQEFFFHCMAGREGLVDTAVKTSRSGYLQRCLIKLLEGLTVGYDMTVRDSDKSVIQFQYGEDSLDVCKVQYLRQDQLKFLYDNKDIILASYENSPILDLMNENHCDIEKRRKSIKKWMAKRSKIRTSPFTLFSQCSTIQRKEELVRQWRCLNDKDRRKFAKKTARCPDTVTSVYNPDSNLGSITETLDAIIDNYTRERKIDKSFDQEEFKKILHLKYQHAIVDPGEPVGILAAQSIGEPSTQMTLNTFHFAGRGEMNVTLGIPRLREILMVASNNIKTPSMRIPFLSCVTAKEQEKIRKSLNRVTLQDVLSEVHVKESLNLGRHNRQRLIRIRFDFLSRRHYSHQYCVTPSSILNYFEKTFIPKIFFSTLSTMVKGTRIIVESKAEKSNKKKDDKEEDPDDPEPQDGKKQREGFGEDHASSDEEELHDDADATETRKRNRRLDEEEDVGLDEEEVDFLKEVDLMMNEEEGMENDDDHFEDTFEKVQTNNESDDGFGEMSDERENDDIVLRQRLEPKTKTIDGVSRRQFVLNVLAGKRSNMILDYTFDDEKELWCELVLGLSVEQRRFDMSNVIKKAAQNAVIHEVSGIRRAFCSIEKEVPVLTTEGINIDAMFALETYLDVNKLFCNNIHVMAKYYGIEAANRAIVKEITDVFEVYGIEVNPRHLTLVSDYMTFNGSYRPFNRIGIENNPSPLQQMTFETAVGFLRTATISGKHDTLESPSARLVVGKPCLGGTNTFHMRQKLSGVK